MTRSHMTSAEVSKAAQRLIVDTTGTDECKYCGYAEWACICDQLCFWSDHPLIPPCLEPKEPGEEVCARHLEDYLRDAAIDIFGSAK